MTDLEKLEASVARLEGIENSTIALLKGISSAITATGGDAGRMRTLTTEIDGMADRLAAAVAAVPPVDPAPAPPVVQPSVDPAPAPPVTNQPV